MLLPNFSPGTVVARNYTFFNHIGIVSDRWFNGYPMIFTSTWSRGVIEIPWLEFADGGHVESLGFWGKLPALQVLARARALLGRSYHFFNFNCDHFVRYAHGLKVESPQLQGTAAVLTAVAVVGLAARLRR